MAHDSIFRPAAGAAVALAEPVLSDACSLEETAERDLEATLQLLAERAQFLTAASGVTIAVREGHEMICRAISGASSRQLEALLPPDFGLSTECVRTKQMVNCGDVEKNAHLNQEDCRALGILSMLTVPLVHEQEVVGVIELTADRPCAFEERDLAALSRLSEVILTAVDHAEAAKRAMKEITVAEVASPPVEPTLKTEVTEKAPEPVPSVLTLRRCEACGFPISEERTVCLDCEEAGRTGDGGWAGSLSQFGGQNESWFGTHMYTLATVFIVVLTVVLLALKLR